MGSLEPFVADILAGFTRRCLLICDKAGAGDWQPVGPLGCRFNHCAPMLAAAVSRERAQGTCWHDRMVWAAFLPQVPGLARVRSTRARPPVAVLDLGGYALW